MVNSAKTIVVALGGNAITREHEEGTIHEQFANTRKSLIGVAEMIRQGNRVLLTHGNGPQVGNELIRVEGASHTVPSLPLGIIVADTEGGMGYMIEQCLQNVMHDLGVSGEVATIVTQVLVDRHDPAMRNPTKFVGPFYKEERVEKLRRERGWIIKEDKGRGWRQVVPSPKPIDVVGKRIIKLLVDNGVTVIACGGGGVPVYVEDNGWLEGVDAVVDKDFASALLAREIGAEELMILTGVDKVALDFATPQERYIDTMTVSEAEKHLADGQFPAGSMGPKVAAAIDFIRGGGERVIVTSIERSYEASLGNAGTIVVPDN